MKFSALEIQNFLTIEGARVRLDDRGLHVIQGDNREDSSAVSNGAGKSSLVDALAWVLYGVTARDVKGDAVVNRAAKKNTRVSLVMSNGESTYRVTRHRKHKDHKNALHLELLQATMEGESVVPLTKGTDAETQKEVERLLGSSKEVFLASIYSGQEAMPDLPRMTDRDLKRLVEEAAGLTRIERAYLEARARASAVGNELSMLEVKEDSVRQRITTDELSLESYGVKGREWEAERADRVAAANQQVIEANSTLRALALRVKEIQPQVTEAQELIQELDQQISRHTELNSAAREAERQASLALAAVDRHLLKSGSETIAAIEAQIANARDALAEPCDSCGKPHTEDDLETYVAHRRMKLQDAQKNQELVKARVLRQANEAKQKQELAAQARAAVPDVSAAMAQQAAAREIVETDRQLREQLSRAKLHSDAMQHAHAARAAEQNPYTITLDSLRERITQSGDELAQLLEKKGELQAKKAVADTVVHVFGPSGVRAHILDTVTPFLNQRTADYLSALSDGALKAVWSTLTRTAAGELREKFAIEVTHDRGGDSFAAISGGEKRKVRLATALALQDLVASRATQPLDLFIGDEIDDALDVAGLERLMTILERKARERGTVLVISHNDLSDWADNITTVSKIGEYRSTVEGSLCC